LQKITFGEFHRRGIPLIYNGDIAKVRAEVNRLSKDPEATFFEYMTLAELNKSDKYGDLRSDDPTSDSDHDKQYACSKIVAPLHGRFLKSWNATAQGFAWLRGGDKVTVDDLTTAFPYVTARRLQPTQDYEQKVMNFPRSMPLRFALAHEMITEIEKRYTGFTENNNAAAVRNALISIARGEHVDKTRRKELSDNLQTIDHPLAIWGAEILLLK
jgi:hypothetical protein